MFPRVGELVAVSAFYKKFHDPIEQIIEPTAQLRVSYQNAASAKNYGLEFEFRRRLDALSPALEPFSVNANVTFVRSEVQIREGIGVQTSSNRALQGQSPYVVNVMLGYENLSLGTSANLLYNVFGRRISEVGAQGLPDVYEQPRHQIDFNVKQPLTDRVKLKVTAKNLLDHRVLYKQDQMDFRRYVKGRSFSVGFSYEL
jgi:outer membrane receptor protein involved in Fe transport